MCWFKKLGEVDKRGWLWKAEVKEEKIEISLIILWKPEGTPGTM